MTRSSAQAVLVLLFGIVLASPAADLRQEVVSQREDLRLLQEKLAQVQNDVQAMKGENEELRAGIQRLQGDVKALRDSLDEQKKENARYDEMFRKLDAVREQDRKTIVEEVGREIDRLSKKISHAESSRAEKAAKPVVQEGYEHTVEKGQTLNAIAEAYGVSRKAVMDANKLTKTDLKVGQKLFIPISPKNGDKKDKSGKKKPAAKSD